MNRSNASNSENKLEVYKKDNPSRSIGLNSFGGSSNSEFDLLGVIKIKGDAVNKSVDVAKEVAGMKDSSMTKKENADGSTETKVKCSIF